MRLPSSGSRQSTLTLRPHAPILSPHANIGLTPGIGASYQPILDSGSCLTELIHARAAPEGAFDPIEHCDDPKLKEPPDKR